MAEADSSRRKEPREPETFESVIDIGRSRRLYHRFPAMISEHSTESGAMFRTNNDGVDTSYYHIVRTSETVYIETDDCKSGIMVHYKGPRQTDGQGKVLVNSQ